jgi:hypothetical protein
MKGLNVRVRHSRTMPAGPRNAARGFLSISAVVESKIESAHALVLDKQRAPGPASLEERHVRHRLARIDGYLVSCTVEIAAAEVAAIQPDNCPLRFTSKYMNADIQSQRFQLRTAYLVEPACKRAGVSAGFGIDADFNAIVGRQREAVRHQDAEKRQDCANQSSSVGSHGSHRDGFDGCVGQVVKVQNQR